MSIVVHIDRSVDPPPTHFFSILLGFEIRGVYEDLVRTYSQRSQQRDQAIEALTAQRGRRPTDNEVAVLVRETRPDKLIEISPAEIKQRQIVRLTPEEAQTLTALRLHSVEIAQEREGLGLEPAAPALRYAEQHLFERRSVVQDHDVLAEALRQGRGRIALAEAKGVLGLEESSGAILRVGHQVATRESLDRERQMIATVNRGIGAFDRLGGDHAFLASDRLRPEQQHAVHQVLASRDGAVSLRGAAGTGKTATLQELHRGLTESGRDVLAVAPTRSAVNELQHVGFSEAMTIQRLLVDPQEQANLRDRVLIVDEAGMVSARQMTALLELAEHQAVRVVFSGDTRQLQSVEAGDALRILERESGLRSVSLTQVQRQTAEAYRQAIEALREHPARGFDAARTDGRGPGGGVGGSVAVGGRGVAGGAGPPERARPAELRVGRLRDARRHRAGDRRNSRRATTGGRAGRGRQSGSLRAAALHPGTKE